MASPEPNPTPRPRGRPRKYPVPGEPLAPDAPRMPTYPEYRNDPVGYIRNVLKVNTITPMQEKVCQLTLVPPYKVLVRCGKNVGKTCLGAWLTCWKFDTHEDDCGIITTAPTHRDVVGLLWKEIRYWRQKNGLGGLVGATVPEMRGNTAKHYAAGYTAEKEESFTGRHELNLGFLFDEASGIPAFFWDNVYSMFQSRLGHWWVAFFNPMSLACHAYKEERRGNWHVVEMSALDHPNIRADFCHVDAPVPQAVRLTQVEEMVSQYCDPVHESAREPMDFLWPPTEFATPARPARFYRPQPQFDYNVLGHWPRGDAFGIWSRRTWELCLRAYHGAVPPSVYPTFGVDLAGSGEDFTVIHGRWGPMSFHHERHNGWTPSMVAERLKMLCNDAALRANKNRLALMPQAYDAKPIEPEEILVQVDSDGLGVYLMDNALKGDFNFVGVCASGRPVLNDRYLNKRAELWFEVAAMARNGQIFVGNLPKQQQDLIEDQLLGVTWHPDLTTGKNVVEPKDETKKRLRCSPDDADAFLLAFYQGRTGLADAWSVPYAEKAFGEITLDNEEKRKWEPPATVDRPHGDYYLASDEDDRAGTRWRFGL